VSCNYIDLTQPPYDDTTVSDVYDAQGCAGVGNHFGSNPISVGDCIEVGGVDYRITAVKVKCSGASVYSNGRPVGAPGHSRPYNGCPVEIQLWLQPI